jgi:hypothetical protein
VSTGDAIEREAAWLTTSGDGLPALLKAAGGPFDLVQGYWPRTAAKNRRGVYVTRPRIHNERSASIRTMPTYTFVLKIVWPMLASSGSAEDDQRALDDALDLIVTRVAGPLMDKTHGNRFLSVAEKPAWVDVDVDDPERVLADDRVFRAVVTYSADDFEVSN